MTDVYDPSTAVLAVLRALRGHGIERVLVVPDADVLTNGRHRIRRDDGALLVVEARHGAWSYSTYADGAADPTRESDVHPDLSDIAEDVVRWLRHQPYGPLCGEPSAQWVGDDPAPDDFRPPRCELRVDDGHLTAGPGGGPSHVATVGRDAQGHGRAIVWTVPGSMA